MADENYIDAAGKAAYEACPDQPLKPVPWEHLTGFWRDYWTQIARGVLEHAAGVKGISDGR